MDCRSWVVVGIASVGLLASPMGRVVSAGEHVHHRPKSTQPTPHTVEQAGFPQEVSCIAKKSYGPHYSGGYVGGGTSFGGTGRCGHQGTFGWDYTPFSPLTSRIFLNWSSGRRVQGGFGAYKTDGPKPVERVHERFHEHFGSEE